MAGKTTPTGVSCSLASPAVSAGVCRFCTADGIVLRECIARNLNYAYFASAAILEVGDSLAYCSYCEEAGDQDVNEYTWNGEEIKVETSTDRTMDSIFDLEGAVFEVL